ncbi:hypothetical protein SAMN02745163_03715 [Clostridium cavendishii DSM 21758]|uniref:Uncharacterized protein n=1 Tax=Clostridium cavendishii DSM 21758 TaxID=1121302 RepID=A0A1M6S0C2_9CLOT|nr:hypothetical protein [Clostridium cavendishii]SHK38027.1 hypothetical protein SAMN02745163_03715 [Clostridium cavendishii DSM 21758]
MDLKEQNLIQTTMFGKCIQTQMYNGIFKSVIVIKMKPTVKFYEC